MGKADFVLILRGSVCVCKKWCVLDNPIITKPCPYAKSITAWCRWAGYAAVDKGQEVMIHRLWLVMSMTGRARLGQDADMHIAESTDSPRQELLVRRV